MSLSSQNPDFPLRNISYQNNSWSAGPDMAVGRWYPTITPLGDGTMLATAGFREEGEPYDNRIPEVYASNAWRPLSNANRLLPLYPWMYPVSDGRVFYAGPGLDTGYLNITGDGAWSGYYPTIYNQSRSSHRTHRGTSVMYDDGKILIAGGTPDDNTAPTNSAEVIDLNAAPPLWRNTRPMAFPRQHLNATLLPDGKVLVTGGTRTQPFSNAAGAVLAAEMWDPTTETWTTLASMRWPRLHHSVAVLLPDGRVVVGGGGQPTGEGDSDHYDVEIFSPPYLFKGKRPKLTSAPARVSYGQQFSVKSPDASSIQKVTWVRLSSVTHGFNQNQRINRLSFTRAGNDLNVTAPSNGNLCPPGHYMLFILNSNGVPSVAKIIQII